MTFDLRSAVGLLAHHDAQVLLTCSGGYGDGNNGGVHSMCMHLQGTPKLASMTLPFDMYGCKDLHINVLM